MSFSLIQSANGSVGAANATSVTVTSSATGSGHLLVAFVSILGNAGVTITPPTGWTQVGTSQGVLTGSGTIAMYYKENSTSGVTSHVFSFSASVNAAVSFEEWSGVATSSSLDQFVAQQNAKSAATPTGTTAALAGAGELAIWGAGVQAAGVLTYSAITNSYVQDTSAAAASSETSRAEANLFYNTSVGAAATSSAATASGGGGTGNTTILAVFKPAPSTPVLATSPSSLSFSATVGGSNPANQSDTLSETAGAATAWTSAITYGSGSGWLSISPTSGSLAASGNQTITVSCALGSLVAGTYTGTITFTATTGGATATISVTFTVSGAPPPAQPSTSPGVLNFTAVAGGSNPASQNDTLSNTGGVSSSWTSSITYTSGSGWLAISPTSGTLGAGANTTVVFTCTTGSLTVGTYSASVTFTMGSNQATVTVSFRITAPPITSYTILLAGQNITQYVDQMSVEVTDTLGQGAGAGSGTSTQGRASTVKFNTSLGPVGTAVGAGQALPGGGPWLVRQGEVQVYDATGTIIFGGFVTKLTDTSTSILGQTKKNFTALEGIDYSTSLQRTLVNEVFTGATDIQIIQYIMNKYVGWVNLQYLPTNAAYTFAAKNFRNVSVEGVLQTVAGITGYLVFVDYLKNLHYVSPTTASSAPFNLSSAPDFITSFPHAVEEYLVDDNSAINRVFFYGGTKTSNDFWQDISPLANGNNVTFPLAYYPSPMTDGKYHIKINGVDGTMSTSTSSGASGQFISQGGTATVLIDPGAKAITFDTGYAPAAGATVLAGYRYAFPLSLIITDEGSHRYYGGAYLDGSIDDNTIFDITTAIQRCKVLLSQQSYGLVTLKADVYRPGVQAGMVIHVYNQLRGINGTYLVQEVQISPYGAGNFVYHLTLGAWNWNLIDFLMKLPTLATFQDDQTQTQETVNIVQVLSNVQVHDAWSKKLSTQGVYYARSSPVGDGHDAYPGFSTVTT